MSSRIFIGTAGWSYKDWEGRVYPKDRSVDPLEYVARFFSAIEINSSFYRPPTSSMTERWARIARLREGFRFTAKLFRGFTHQAPQKWSTLDQHHFIEGMKPLVDGGVLGVVLAQFPWYFRASSKTMDHLERIAAAFSNFSLALEVRDKSWLELPYMPKIAQLGFTFCNIDQPLAKTSIAASSLLTSDIGYLRLHGRNRMAWFDKEAGRDDKYDYLYSTPEIESFVSLVDVMSEKARDIYVIANNHFQGKAAANALELTARIFKKKVPVPPSLLEAYPHLNLLRLAE